MKHVSKLTVVPAKVPVFYVLDAFDSSGVASSPVMYETNMTFWNMPSVVSQKFRIPCRHIQAVLYELERRNPGNLPLVSTIQDLFTRIDIRLPVDDGSSEENKVLPPPRQARGPEKKNR
ncbi:LOW QUALITY PROTEIN: hypothetical protein PHMEG_00011430 [Phytophthora megakarya]|uniref:Uncharacterized protein n=1 Tax=Phytophthora megakarya TaxID=4795 RepID=A0A225WDS4_9STRA|nr:LOW QUALITY PROTEIN: hypothetical protein PHMEG_00011430 [Phytophthora megakarya]